MHLILRMQGSTVVLGPIDPLPPSIEKDEAILRIALQVEQIPLHHRMTEITA